MAETTNLNAVIDTAAHRDLRIDAAVKGVTMSWLVRCLVVAYLEGEIQLPDEYLDEEGTYEYNYQQRG